MADWKLLIEDDAGKTIVVPLVRDVITIGRKEGNTIRLTERNVSRFHARLEKASQQVFIEDLESYNGVKINGDRIKGKVEVREGDLIEIGDYHLALQNEAALEPVPTETNRRPLDTDLGDPTESGPSGTSDEFAGDTQRWQPPAAMDPLAVGAPSTHDAATDDLVASLDLGETARFPPAPSADGESISTTEERRAALPEVAPAQTTPPEAADDDLPLLTDLEPEALDDTIRSPTFQPGVSFPDADPSHGAPAIARAEAPLPVAPPAPSAFPVGAPVVHREDEQTEAVPRAPASSGDRHLGHPRLVALNTVFAGTVFPILHDEVEVGRTEENDLTIQHKSVSRSHCKLQKQGNSVRIHDLKSANGILVNGEERDGVELRSGDEVELGRVRLRFVPAGERFALSPEEIERARVADISNDEWAEESGLVQPNTSLPQAASPKAKAPVGLIAAGLLLVAVLLGVLAWMFGGKPDPSDQTERSEGSAAAVSAGDPEVASQLARGKASMAQGRWGDALAAFDAAEAAGGDVAALRQRVAGERRAEQTLAAVKQAFQAQKWDEVRTLTESIPPDHRAYAEAQRYADDASEKLAQSLSEAANTYLDDRRFDEAEEAIDRLRQIDGDTERVSVLRTRLASSGAESAGMGRRSSKRASSQRSRAASRARRDDRTVTSTLSGNREQAAARVAALETEAQQLLLQGNGAGAVVRLQEALKLSPGRPTLHRQLTMAYLNQGERGKARAHFERYKALNPTARDLSQLEARLQ